MKRKLLTTKEIQTILAHYEIGKYITRRFINTTIENQNYLLTTTRGMFLLKSFDTDDVQSLTAQNDLLAYLSKKAITVPKLVYNKDKGSVTTHDKRHYTIYTFMKGERIGQLTDALCRSFGREVGQMHAAMLHYRGTGTKNIPSYYRPEDLAAMHYRELRQSMIHGDLGASNVLQHKGRVTAIIDFGDARWDFLVKDIAVLLTMFLSERNKRYLPVFLKEYQRWVSLSDAERACIPFLTRSHIQGVLEWLKDQAKNAAQTNAQQLQTRRAIRYFERAFKYISCLEAIV